MSEKGVFKQLKALHLPIAYHHFEEGHSPSPPLWFIIVRNQKTLGQTIRFTIRARNSFLNFTQGRKTSTLKGRLKLFWRNNICFWQGWNLYWYRATLSGCFSFCILRRRTYGWKNKVTFGLQDVHWAEVTTEGSDGALTYGNVERLRGAAELTLEATGDSGSYKADNINFYTTESNDGYSGTLKVAL